VSPVTKCSSVSALSGIPFMCIRNDVVARTDPRGTPEKDMMMAEFAGFLCYVAWNVKAKQFLVSPSCLTRPKSIAISKHRPTPVSLGS
jgi:hypothetical protein